MAEADFGYIAVETGVDGLISCFALEQAIYSHALEEEITRESVDLSIYDVDEIQKLLSEGFCPSIEELEALILLEYRATNMVNTLAAIEYLFLAGNGMDFIIKFTSERPELKFAENNLPSLALSEIIQPMGIKYDTWYIKRDIAGED